MKKVLIVDDYEENRYMLDALLTGSGYASMVAHDGAEALEMARNDPPDLIITDILMPVMDGHTLCRNWKSDPKLRNIPLVFYTATYTDPKDEAFGMSLGAERFIRKPAEPEDFLTIIRSVLYEAKMGELVAPLEPEGTEVVFVREYNEVLIRKLEHKLKSLEMATERLEAEAEERAALIERQEDQNAELERFVYTVSHDLKTPLVTITGFLGMLEEDIASRASASVIRNDIDEISAAAVRMKVLLDHLLELARIGRKGNPPEDVSLIDIVQAAVDSLSPQIADAKVRVEVASDLPVVHGDRFRLAEVFQNLIENALKYSAGVSDPVVHIGVRNEAGEQIIYVRDNGIGIDPKYADRVFMLFEQLSPDHEGTGIGLTLVKRIIEVHGGRVWIESEGAGKGCTVCFTLPQP